MSSLPLPILPHVPNISKAEQAYPNDYVELVKRRLLARGEVAEISAPAPYEPWSINEAMGWSVCLKRANANVALVVFTEGKITGSVVPAPAGHCEAATYTPIERAPLPA